MAELLPAARQVGDADLVELRLDSVDRPDVAGGPRWPVAGSRSSSRAARRGRVGSSPAPKKSAAGSWPTALARWAEYVDVEEARPSRFVACHRAAGGIVLRTTTSAACPRTGAEARAAMRPTQCSGAEVVKIARHRPPARRPVAPRALRRRRYRARVVLIGMGVAGVPAGSARPLRPLLDLRRRSASPRARCRSAHARRVPLPAMARRRAVYGVVGLSGRPLGVAGDAQRRLRGARTRRRRTCRSRPATPTTS